MNKEYILVENIKLAEIKYKALQKLAANKERPLSEASIEARVVIDVVNYIYENNEYCIHKSPEYIGPGMITINISDKEVEKILDAEYNKYVEYWGDIDPINYKLYSIETDMPCFHPDNRLFTIKEFEYQRFSNKAFREMWELK